VIPVGETIAWLVAPGEKPPVKTAAAAPAAGPVSGGTQAKTTVISASEAAKGSVEGAALQISPKARRLAKELSVDFTQVLGTGPGGVITAEDVQKFADPKSSDSASVAMAPAPATEALSQVARLMAERTTQSWTSVPHFFLVSEVDAGELTAAQKRLSVEAEKTKSAVPTITDFLLALTARTLAKHARMNASWAGDGILANAEINVSFAVAVKDGVVGAVIRDADTLTIAEITTQRRELAERARAGKLRPADITGGTFTLSNLGMYRVDAFSAIITPPQAAVLAVGAISDRVVALEGKAVVRPMMTMTLSSDHRVVDGARAAEFLSDLTNAIRDPGKLL